MYDTLYIVHCTLYEVKGCYEGKYDEYKAVCRDRGIQTLLSELKAHCSDHLSYAPVYHISHITYYCTITTIYCIGLKVNSQQSTVNSYSSVAVYESISVTPSMMLCNTATDASTWTMASR